MTLRPLGRVMAAPVRRFDDKHPDSVAQHSIDLSDWIAERDGDTLDSATVVSTDLTISSVSAEVDRVTWLAADGTDGTDAEITITATSADGRVLVEVWNCLVVA